MSGFFARNPTVCVLTGWSLFAATHVAASHPPNRRRLIARFGDDTFRLGYSAVSLLTFVPMAVIRGRYGNRSPLIHSMGRRFLSPVGVTSSLLHITAAGMLVQAMVQPPPVAMTLSPEQKKVAGEERVTGIARVTRAPGFAALGLWGIAMALRRGRAADFLFFMGFPLFGYYGGRHQDYRMQVDRVLPSRYYEQTSLIPFRAIYEGRQVMPTRQELWDPVREIQKLIDDNKNKK